MNKNDKIYIAGHTGLVGSAFVRHLKKRGFDNLIYRNHKDLDLTNQFEVESFFSKERPDYVILAAAKVGGIFANNTYPADFIYSNILIEANVIHSAYKNNVVRLLFLGSTCIYPKAAKQPMTEDLLLSGVLESTNEPYALAKIAGIKLCESYNRQYKTDFRSVMPTNLYGINDNFHLNNSHVVPAIMRKLHLAKCLEQNDWQAIKKDIKNNLIDGFDQKSNETQIILILEKHGIRLNTDSNRIRVEVTLWGSGNSKREFLLVDEMVSASMHVFESNETDFSTNTNPTLSHVNIGTGLDISINELTEIIRNIVGFKGKIVFDKSKPDGPQKKLTDVSRLKSFGWNCNPNLEDGLKDTYQWYVNHNK